MSRLTPLIHSTDNPATSLSISVALGKDSLIWDLAFSSLVCGLFFLFLFLFLFGQGTNRNPELVQGLIIFPSWSLKSSPICRFGCQFSRVQPSCKLAPEDSFLCRQICFCNCLREEKSAKRKRGSTFIHNNSEKLKHNLTEDFIRF